MSVASAPAPAEAGRVFGDRLPMAERYAGLLVEHGVERGLIGPREVPRIWDRHVLNSAAIGELLPSGAGVLDVGSGAGLPGIPLAIARPDLRVVLLEPMARRVAWLTEVIHSLALPVSVLRGRAEERPVRERVGDVDVVTARAVAPLAKLAGWCLPLLRPGGMLVALKGASAAEEIARDAAAIRRLGGSEPSIKSCGGDVLATPTTVVVMFSEHRPAGRDDRRRTRKDR